MYRKYKARDALTVMRRCDGRRARGSESNERNRRWLRSCVVVTELIAAAADALRAVDYAICQAGNDGTRSADEWAVLSSPVIAARLPFLRSSAQLFHQATTPNFLWSQTRIIVYVYCWTRNEFCVVSVCKAQHVELVYPSTDLTRKPSFEVTLAMLLRHLHFQMRCGFKANSRNWFSIFTLTFSRKKKKIILLPWSSRLTDDLDLRTIHAKYLGRISFRSKGILSAHTHNSC